MWFTFSVNPMFNDAIGWLMWLCGKRKRIRWTPTFIQNLLEKNWGPGQQRHDGSWGWSQMAGKFGADMSIIPPMSPVSPSGEHVVYVKLENLDEIVAALKGAEKKNLVHNIRVD